MWRVVTVIFSIWAGCGGGYAPMGANPGGDSGAVGPAEDPCTRYVSCIHQVAPDQAAGATAAYGPNGACWMTQSHDACLQGCATGLSALHHANPSASACALCASDGDCSGTTPACDLARGECVSCVRNDQCTGALHACDPTSQTCVMCAKDSDCGGATPACDTANHICVACTLGSQCASHRCESNHRCCVPNAGSCSATAPKACGFADDGCGNMVDCGTCAVGTCVFGGCSTVGMACSPGGSTCAPSERCMFNATTSAYECHRPSSNPDASSCQILGAYYCPDNSGSGRFYVCSSATTSMACTQLCLTAQDCVAGTPCSPYFDKTTVSASKPGYCH